MAAVEDGDVLLLEPLAGHLIVFSISLHGSNVNLVAGVENVHLPEDAGHVAELAHVLLHQVLELLFEAVIELEGIIGLSLLESSHEPLHHGAEVIALVGIISVRLNALEHLGEHPCPCGPCPYGPFCRDSRSSSFFSSSSSSFCRARHECSRPQSCHSCGVHCH